MSDNPEQLKPAFPIGLSVYKEGDWFSARAQYVYARTEKSVSLDTGDARGFDTQDLAVAAALHNLADTIAARETDRIQTLIGDRLA